MEPLDISNYEDTNPDLSGDFETQARSVPHLASKRTLVLNADMAPICYRPLSTKPWTTIFFWLVKGWDRVKEGGMPIITVLEEYEDTFVHTRDQAFALPSVVAHTSMVPLSKKPALTRENIFLRDSYTCQYTGIQYPRSELNLDHVEPVSRGGRSTWGNMVACHRDLNFKKADRTPQEAGLRLIREPYEPTGYDLRAMGQKFPVKLDHPSWEQYVTFL